MSAGRYSPASIAALLPEFKELPPELRPIVLHASSERSLRKAVRTACAPGVCTTYRAEVLAPDDLKDESKVRGWREAVWSAAELPSKRATLAEAWPSGDAALRSARKKAKKRLPAALDEAESSRSRLDAHQQERELHDLSPLGSADIPDLVVKRRYLLGWAGAMIGVEVISVTTTLVMSAGINEYGNLAAVPATTWLLAVFSGIPVAASAFGLAYLIGRLTERHNVGIPGFRGAGLVACGVAAVILAGVMVVLRLYGLTVTEQIDPALRGLHDGGIAVVGGVLSLGVMAAIVEALRRQVVALDARIIAASKPVKFLGSRETKATDDHASAVSMVRRLKEAIRRPMHYAACFEREVAHARELRAQAEARVDTIVEAAARAWSAVQCLSQAERQYLREHLEALLASTVHSDQNGGSSS